MDIHDVESASKVYQNLLTEEAQLQAEMQDLLRTSDELEDRVKRLRHRIPDPSILRVDAADLMQTITFSGSLAAGIASRIKKMDLVEKRVLDCLSRVTDIVDLKTCTEGIQSALDNEEYENAALIVQRFLKMDEEEIRRSSLSKSSLDQAFTKLHDAKKKLQNMVLRKFDEAVAADDVASVERFFKLFPFLNQEKEGLRKFSNYLSSKIHDGTSLPSKATTPAINATLPASHPEQLGNLFQVIAKIIDVHQPLVETYYKHGHLLSVVEVLQKECDRRAKRIIDDFHSKRDLQSTVSLITKSLKQSQSITWSGNASGRIEPRELDALLTEIIFVTSRSETYLTFIRRRVEEDFSIASPDPKSQERVSSVVQVENLIRNCQLSRVVQEMSGSYVLMEEYFLKESMMKAIELDEEQETEEYTVSSNMLDDVFFIVKKCVKRASSSGNMDVLCAVINHTNALLDTTFAEALNDRIRYGFPNSIAALAASLDLSQAYNALQSGRYLQSSADLQKTKMLFLTGVNSLDQVNECIVTLKQHIRDEVSRSSILNTGHIRQNGKLDSALLDLSSLTSKFQNLSRRGVHQMYLSILKPRIKIWTEGLTIAENELSEEEMNSLESSEGLRPFTSGLLFEVDQTLKLLKPQLTNNNYNNLITEFAEEFCRRAEAAILKSSFNKLGAFLLDREIRAVINYVTSCTSRPIRDKFSKLKKILLLLNVESVSEAAEHFGSSSSASGVTSQSLTPSEVRSFLRLRVDLSSDDLREQNRFRN